VSLLNLLVFFGLVAIVVGTYVPLAAALQKSKRTAAQLRAEVSELETKTRELSTQLAANQDLIDHQCEQLKNATSYIHVLEHRGLPTGTRTYFLEPVLVPDR
jgi:septal ring factor EnvC (AmiA/AmiB activator)